MIEQLEKWLRHYDPIHRGYTPQGIANGVCATRGFAFPRVAGGYNLYRALGEVVATDDAEIVGAASANALAIATFAWRPAAAATAYHFAVTAIGGGGVESAVGAFQVAVAFDDDGLAVAPVPNAPVDLRVTPLADGCFEVAWRYDMRDEAVSPERFDVFGGAGAVDYETPLGNVTYRARAGWYAFVTEGYAHDAVGCFGVRAVSAAGVDDGNTVIACGRAQAVGPPVHREVFAAVVEAE
ncbi:MAG: hypothetical protein H6817_00305 [Phycisphaerales bacterium]|nr:hypothetical protein [Phycisphaerales bacterium]